MRYLILCVCVLMLLLLPCVAAADAVVYEPSGVFRGSFRHIIQLGELEPGESVELSGLNAGDFISGRMPDSPPYVRFASNHVYVRKFYDQPEGWEVVYDFGVLKLEGIFEGESVALDFNGDGTDDGLLFFNGTENRKGIFTFIAPGGSEEEESVDIEEQELGNSENNESIAPTTAPVVEKDDSDARQQLSDDANSSNEGVLVIDSSDLPEDKLDDEPKSLWRVIVDWFANLF